MLSCALTLAAALVAGQTAGAVAAPSSTELQSQVDAKQQQANDLNTKLEALRSQLSTSLAEYNRLSDKLDSTKREMQLLENQLDILKAARNDEQAKLQQLAVDRYQSGTLGDLEVLFGAETLQDLVTRIDFLAFVGQRNADVIDTVTTQQVQTERVQASVQQRAQDIGILRDQADAQRKQIASLIDQQSALLNGVNAEIGQLLIAKQHALAAEAAARQTPTHAEDPSGATWMNAVSLVPGASGYVDGGADAWIIPAGVPTKYKSVGLSYDWVSSTYGNPDNSPPNSTASASRRPFHDTELTCATPGWPFGTLLAVSYNGRRVIVVCTDRGPYISGRSLDLSTAAANAIGLPGVATVHVDIVVPAQ